MCSAFMVTMQLILGHTSGVESLLVDGPLWRIQPEETCGVFELSLRGAVKLGQNAEEFDEEAEEGHIYHTHLYGQAWAQEIPWNRGSQSFTVQALMICQL